MVETSVPRLPSFSPELLRVTGRQRLCCCPASSSSSSGEEGGGARDGTCVGAGPLVLQLHRVEGSALGAHLKRAGAALPGRRSAPAGWLAAPLPGAPSPRAPPPLLLLVLRVRVLVPAGSARQRRGPRGT